MSTLQIIKYIKVFFVSLFLWLLIDYIFDMYLIDSYWSFLCEFFLVGFWFLSGLRLFMTFGLTLSYLTIRNDRDVDKSDVIKATRCFVWDKVYKETDNLKE